MLIIGLLLGGGTIFVVAVLGIVNNNITGDEGVTLAMFGIVAIILGAIMVKTS